MSVAGCETACPGVMPAAVGYSQELYCWGRILGPGSAALLFPAPPTATLSAIPCPRCHFLSTYYMPSIILGVEDTVITQKKHLFYWNFFSW